MRVKVLNMRAERLEGAPASLWEELDHFAAGALRWERFKRRTLSVMV